MTETRNQIGIMKSIWQMKCPRCRQGDLFNESGMSTKFTEMPERCEVCNQNYMPEPGFYYGAMFISYIWTAWFCLFFVGGGMLFFDMSVNGAFILLIIIMVIMFTWIFRISRSIWIHIAVKYQPNLTAKSSVKK